MTDKERLMHSLEAIEDYLCERPARVGDALFVLECIKANMEFQDVVSTKTTQTPG